jgi:ABC-2 type transport system permease protein
MKRYLIFYKAIVKQYFLGQIQYRVVAYSWLVGKILEPLIYLIIWVTVSNLKNGEINGLTTDYFISYYVVLMIVSQFTFTDLIWRFGNQINSGDFSNKLILPIHPLHYDIAENIGYKLFSMPVILLSAILTAMYFKAVFNITVIKIVIFLPIVLLSWLLRLLFEWMVSLSAFWFVNVKGISTFYYVMLLFFSGRVIPLNIFPLYLREIADYLPFRYMISYPIEILLNNYSVSYIIENTFIQTLWLGSVIFILVIVYNLGIKKYTAVGG